MTLVHILVAEAKQKLENANAALDDLLSKVAHNMSMSFCKTKRKTQMSDMLSTNNIDDEDQETFYYIMQRCFFEPAGFPDVREGVG